ncbi:MAG: aminoacyl-tRNA hydrolase [Oscillospiraceae bacterium]|nr:aminoacyl-tRNA hydrolase [Oscillospiraceae bacterium]
MLFAKKSGGVQWLLVCLGNPGPKYEHTRHNMGFLAADLLAEREHIKINRIRFKAVTAELTFGGQRVLVMKPQTYMNLSGEAVGEAVRFYKIPADHVLVIYDDVSLPVGKIRVRPSGSAGGHNGIKNIIAHLGTDVFPRVKVGVGSPAHPDHEMIDWVIGVPPKEDRKVLLDSLNRALDAAACVIENGTDRAMNQFN